MELSTLPSPNTNSVKQTNKSRASPTPPPQYSSRSSINCRHAKQLMKKKERQYQNQLLIEDAERAHNFLSQLQEKEKNQKKAILQDKKRRMKRQIMQYKTSTIQNFEEEWSSTFAKTIRGLEEVEVYLSQQQEEELNNAAQQIEKAKAGKGLQKMKFSSQVLSMEDQLRRLIKSQRYQEAYVVRSRLEKSKKTEMRNFISQSVDRQRRSLQKLKKKQARNRQLVGDRLTAVYIKQKNLHEKEYELLVKNMKTYEIDLTKIESRVKRKERSQQEFSREPSQSSGDIVVPQVDFRFDVETTEKKTVDVPKPEPETAAV